MGSRARPCGRRAQTAEGSRVMAEEISGEALDAYLAQPDCPQCGSDDVVCTKEMPDGMGGTLRVWYCRKCGHTWTERA